jgi:hypothetical protein
MQNSASKEVLMPCIYKETFIILQSWTKYKFHCYGSWYYFSALLKGHDLSQYMPGGLEKSKKENKKS